MSSWHSLGVQNLLRVSGPPRRLDHRSVGPDRPGGESQLYDLGQVILLFCASVSPSRTRCVRLQTHSPRSALLPWAAHGGWDTSGQRHPFLCTDLSAVAGYPVMAWPGCFQPSQRFIQCHRGKHPSRVPKSLRALWVISLHLSSSPVKATPT